MLAHRSMGSHTATTPSCALDPRCLAMLSGGRRRAQAAVDVQRNEVRLSADLPATNDRDAP